MQAAVHRHPLRIYVADTDVSGFVHHANYLKYAERARTEMLRDYGIEHAALVARGEGVWVVAEVSARYLRSAYLDDALEVRSRPVKVGAAATTIEHRITRGDETLVELTITVAWVTMDGRPQRQPAHWRQTFQAIADATRDAW